MLPALLACIALAASHCGGTHELAPRSQDSVERAQVTQATLESPAAFADLEDSEDSSEPAVAGLEEEPLFLSLPVPGYGNAIVSIPEDTSVPRPILLAAHGAGDKPTWQCQIWRDIIKDRGFVVCPQGTRMGWGSPAHDMGFFFRNHHALEKEVMEVLRAFRARFGPRVAPGPVVYAGYSQGGIMGALMVVKHPHLFSRLILVEGGEAEWDVPTAARFREGGGHRVLLVCGRQPCAERARRSLMWLHRGGVQARHEFIPGGGHTYGGSIAQRLAETFDWVVEGDPHWTAP